MKKIFIIEKIFIKNFKITMSLQKIATLVSSSTAFVLVAIKLTFGLMSGSVALLSSAIDSLLDMFVSVFNYFAVKNAEKPADEQFNYGRWKIEALAAFIEWVVIFISGGYILYKSYQKFFSVEPIEYLGISLWVMVLSLLITGGLVLFLEHVAKKTKNLVIESDALHYKTDLWSNAWVLVSLGIIYFTNWYIVDAIVGWAIAIFIMYSALEVLKKWFLMLMDVALEEEEVSNIEKIILSAPSVNNYHYLKTRQSWNVKFVDVHVVYNPYIHLLDAHNSADDIIDEINELDRSVKWIVNIHLDPFDDSKEDSAHMNSHKEES